MEPVPWPRFEELVETALEAIPADLLAALDNLAPIVVADRHPDEPGLLGLYEGIPLTERAEYGAMVMPDQVTLYRLALCDICADEDELIDEVAVTVVHELAHHFGIDDERLHELGWA